MHILVLNYEYPPLGGGAAPLCKQLCHAIAARGHTLDVVTMRYPGLPQLEEEGSVTVRRTWALRRKQATCETHEMVSYVAGAFGPTLKMLRRNAYDVIHVHFLIPTGLLAWLLSFFSDVPIVITPHGSDIPGYNPDRFRFEHHFTGPGLRRIVGRASRVVAPSHYLRGLLTPYMGGRPAELIPNGIPVDRFDPSVPKQNRLLMTGRLLPRKGFAAVLEALAGMDTDFEVHIAGDGPQRNELLRLAERCKAKVVFHGWIGREPQKLHDLYETSSIFCLPSMRENASVSLLEAMLAGMAVITSNVTGCPETIGDAGIVVRPCDAASLREPLGELLSSEKRRRELGAKARARVLANYDLAKTAEAYLGLFNEVIEEHRR